MLHEFLIENRDDLVRRCQVKVARRSVPPATAGEVQYGIPTFLGQLIDTLRNEHAADSTLRSVARPHDIGSTAKKHGNELLRRGFSVDQVVHDYGDLCQAITELAVEKRRPISVEEFHTFNGCLDNAIADAVTEFGRQRDQNMLNADTKSMNERLGSFAHELRNLLHSAMLAFQALEAGSVAVRGATAAVLGRSLIGLGVLIDRSLADVRLSAGQETHRESVVMHELIDEVQIAAAMDAKAKGVRFSILTVDKDLVVEVDRLMLASAVANLLQNAFKFTRAGGHVSLRAYGVTERAIIEIQDECGGLPPGKLDELFQPFQQRNDDRTGLGLGLSISRRGVEANGGELRVQDLPGTGCVFTINLPRQPAAVGGAEAA